MQPITALSTRSLRPTREQLLAARGGTIPDILTERLGCLFVGINPSLYSAAVGHHFARPGNRFWPALAGAKITPRQLRPAEDRQLLVYRCGLTNLVARATARADELSVEEIRLGKQRLVRKLARRRVDAVAFLGVSAYRQAFDAPGAHLGRQDGRLGKSSVWVLPNPSGLNAHYQLPDFVRLFAELKAACQLRSPIESVS